MLRLVISLLVLAGGIALFVMLGTVLLPVILTVMVLWFLAALLTPARRPGAPRPGAYEPGVEEASSASEDLPAGQAVIDVTAQVVEEKESQ